MKIYTRQGDQGMTSMYCGQAKSKGLEIVQALGDNDELSSRIGFIVALIESNLLYRFYFRRLHRQLTSIQRLLQDVNSGIATINKVNQTPLSPVSVSEMEDEIDRLTERLPPLRYFILPGGTELSSRVHLARTAARQAERSFVVALKSGNEPHLERLDIELQFLNRLSDYFFTVGRWTEQQSQKLDRLALSMWLFLGILCLTIWTKVN